MNISQRVREIQNHAQIRINTIKSVKGVIAPVLYECLTDIIKMCDHLLKDIEHDKVS